MRRFLILLAILLATPLAAQDTMPPAPLAYTQLDDPAAEARARDLMETLRCVECQSQSIADSDAPMAGEMRHEVRTRISEGQSADEVRGWLIARYGDYISYEPQLSRVTWPLFAIPAILLMVAGLVLWRRLGRGRDPRA